MLRPNYFKKILSFVCYQIINQNVLIDARKRFKIKYYGNY